MHKLEVKRNCLRFDSDDVVFQLFCPDNIVSLRGFALS